MKITTATAVEEWKVAPKVIVTGYFTMVREQPNSSSLPVRDAVAGALMKLVRTSGQWTAVELPDGRAGFIEKSNVEEYVRWKNSRKLTAENIEKTAKQFLGVPYLWEEHRRKASTVQGSRKQCTG